MDQQAYTDHLYDRLQQHAGPLALRQLAKRIQTSVKLKLAVVSVSILKIEDAPQYSALAGIVSPQTLRFTTFLEEGSPIESALDQIPAEDRVGAVITNCMYADPNFCGNVSVARNTPAKIAPVTDFRGDKHPQHYQLHLQIGGDIAKASKYLEKVVVEVHIPTLTRVYNEVLTPGEHLNVALQNVLVSLVASGDLLVYHKIITIKDQTTKACVNLEDPVVLGHYYDMTISPEGAV